MRAVIYAFRSPGSGAVYIGKHQCCPDGWPRRGTGPLPDGYRGSGVAVANFHRRHGAAVQWRILATVALSDWQLAERRAIRVARLILGRKCVNRADGGEGLTSGDFNQIWSNPKTRAKLKSSAKARIATPEGAAQLAKFLAAAKTPEALAKISASNRAWAKTAEGLAHLARNRASARKPEARAKLSASQTALALTPARKAQLARATAILRINNSWRKLFCERPDLFDVGVKPF